MRQRALFPSNRRAMGALLAAALAPAAGWSQTQANPAQPPPASAALQATGLASSLRELQEQVRELKTALSEVRAEAVSARAETAALRHELEAARMESATANGHSSGTLAVASPSSVGEQAKTIERRLDKLEEDQQIADAKINEQYQTKVESASKYRVRFSGIALLNVFATRGAVDSLNFPTLAFPSQATANAAGSFAGTVLQSELGLEVFGPQVAKAKTSASVQMDFSGGLPAAPNGSFFGLLRLRTATVRLDWERTSIVAGQDNLFFAPIAPTSFASLAVPALASSGKLWGWTPQVRVEHRLISSPNGTLLVQGGILDGLTGENPQSFPAAPVSQFEFYRTPNAAERSSQPAYAARLSWSRRAFGRNLTIGAGGYYDRQNWLPGSKVDAWAATSDVTLPLTRWLQLSGEFYRGRALGGLGGAIGQTVLTLTNNNALTAVRPISSEGGWSQVKFIPRERFEINAAYGQDVALATGLHGNPIGLNFSDLFWTRNQTGFANFVYRPRSDWLLSAEYRHLRTSVPGGFDTADLLDLSLGILF